MLVCVHFLVPPPCQLVIFPPRHISCWLGMLSGECHHSLFGFKCSTCLKLPMRHRQVHWWSNVFPNWSLFLIAQVWCCRAKQQDVDDSYQEILYWRSRLTKFVKCDTYVVTALVAWLNSKKDKRHAAVADFFGSCGRLCQAERCPTWYPSFCWSCDTQAIWKHCTSFVGSYFPREADHEVAQWDFLCSSISNFRSNINVKVSRCWCHPLHFVHFVQMCFLRRATT